MPDTPGEPLPFRFDPVPPPAPPAERGPAPAVRYGEEGLPEPVALARRRLMEAARTGEIERLRPVFDAHGGHVTVAFHPVDDPVAFLAAQSGDPQGREILAILIELLSAGWVVVDAGTSRETYVWPYFAHVPLPELTPPQMVELYKILTAVDVEEMERLGEWPFYRVGIAADGTIRYFAVDGF